MNNNKINYINNYNKETYKMFPFRVRKNNDEIINKLLSVPSINSYITSLISKDISSGILTLKQIKEKMLPVLAKHEIKEVYLFGSYSRGEATSKSDIDIYCESGNIKTLIELGYLEEELQNALGKKVDIIFFTAKLDDFFKEQLDKDKIKLC